MSFKNLTNIPLEKAKDDYLDILVQNGMIPQVETIAVMHAGGRTTAEPVHARICAPNHNSGAMDGIALNASLTLGAKLDKPITLTSEQFKMIGTGDALPEDCNTIIISEDVIELEDGSIQLSNEAIPWQNIRAIGEDICTGEMIMLSYSVITPSALGAMIAGGVTEVSVIKRPIVGIIPTGNKLTPQTELPKAGYALEPNSAIFSAMLEQWGAQTITYPIVKDSIEEISKALKEALKQCDVIIINADASDGKESFTAEAISSVGEILYHGIAMKPGKSAILGYNGSKPILGFPGYPVSGIIVIEQLLRPIIKFLCKSIPEKNRYLDAVLSRAVVSDSLHHEFIRVRLGYVGQKLIASPLSRGSGIVTSFMKADGLLEVPQESHGYESGETVSVRLLRPEEQLRDSLIVIGSHDPLLDELAELLRVQYGDVMVASAHVGSMGGLLAIKRGEAHVAGIHLLDAKTGEYNTSFVKKMLSKTGVRLVQCVKRTQGIIVQKGNPLGIKGISDLTQRGLRYVNRQKGSGTRILMDYLCAKEGVETSQIFGYDRAEFTHNAVAAIIAGDSADAGLGIYSAAKLHDLDFVPVCKEQYDLLITNQSWELPMVQKLIAVLSSKMFKERISSLGGYEIDNPGTVREVL